MAKDYNKITLTGRLGGGREGKNPVDLKYMPSGTALATFSVASGRPVRDESDPSGWKDETEWFNVVAWDKLAERLADIPKGTHVLVEGRIQTRKWTDTQGNPRYTTEVVANDVLLLSNKTERDRLSGNNGGGGAADMGGDDDFDELPAPAASRNVPAPSRPAPSRQPAPASTGNGYRSNTGGSAPARSNARPSREVTREPVDDGLEPDDIPF